MFPASNTQKDQTVSTQITFTPEQSLGMFTGTQKYAPGKMLNNNTWRPIDVHKALKGT